MGKLKSISIIGTCIIILIVSIWINKRGLNEKINFGFKTQVDEINSEYSSAGDVVNMELGKYGNYEEEFWNIISMLDWRYEGDDEEVLESAIKYLSKKSNEEIFAFYEVLSKLLYDLDGVEYARNIGEDAYINENKHFSVDQFLYARCCVVANGKEYYYNVLNNPEKMPKDLEFESLLYIAYEAYELKNDEEFDYMAKYSYETFSNIEKWQEK